MSPLTTVHKVRKSSPTAAQHVAFKKGYEDHSPDQFIVEDQEKSCYYQDEEEAEEGNYKGMINTAASLRLTELQVPKFNMDWTQDPFWTQLRSPWLGTFMTPPYANVLNF
ncbi:hypothetical protein RHMOL_Rhmol05G0056800 [Rhododendron molle]|uniref:Uncharacterized protein n=1 Tax=Rhododendron molle TaxID=49168 RepID=A0ACC0NL51_RHOML|nr:hypothetical protein RHMOL_Rhmol05G0056800 [Rhododendron molle]